MHHWTDPKIRVHVFHWVLALAIAHLMPPRAQRILTDTTGTQQRLAQLFNIDRYAPTR